MTFDMREVDHLAADLTAAPVKVNAASVVVVAQTAHSTARDAAILAPKFTGYLSEHIEVHEYGLAALVIATARYSGYVEEGTSDTAPQPFMRPAAERNVSRLADGLGDAGEDIL